MVPLYDGPLVADRGLPESLRILYESALDLRWSWNHYGDELWRTINPDLWQYTQNPVSILQLTPAERFQQLAKDETFKKLLQDIRRDRDSYFAAHTWFKRNFTDNCPGHIAYFSMEFGLCEALPLYAGGLGVLAGDYLKTASDLGVPVIGIGLLYQQGYFRQQVGPDGRQRESYLYNEPGDLPVVPVLQADGSWLQITLHLFSRKLRFRVWRAQVGRVPLYLLDSNDPTNQPSDRCITSALYSSGTKLRLLQQIALGIGGWRLIEMLNLPVEVCHLNEGHAAFATLERIRSYAEKNHLDFWQSLWATRGGNVFTTHTPVAAGFDCYSADLLNEYAKQYANILGVSTELLMQLGRADPGDASQSFNMAYLAMRTCARSNGVSELHGKVSQQIFQPLFPRWPQREVPIGHVTNGVHMPTWDSRWADDLWTLALGKERWRGETDTLDTAPLQHLDDGEIAQLANRGRAQLVDYVRQRIARQDENLSVENCGLMLDANTFTMGFARRFAEYKRPDLLLADPDRLARLLTNAQLPVQLIIAGKAHPADELGKHALQHWIQFIQRPDVKGRVVFIEDYDIALAQQLIQGVDLWLSTPRRPWEACGTSGMKVLVNGGLNLSSLDGWWAEAYGPDVGWALGDGLEHSPDQDLQDAQQLYHLLENEVIPLFYERNARGLNKKWLGMIRNSMTKLTPRFSSNRMMRDYICNYYLPATQDLRARQANNNEIANSLHEWAEVLQKYWHQLRFEAVKFLKLEDGFDINASIFLGDINPEYLSVQLIADPSPSSPAVLENLLLLKKSGMQGFYHCQLNTNRPASDFTLRIIPSHMNAKIPAELPLIVWQR